jgi:hypothetical protein
MANCFFKYNGNLFSIDGGEEFIEVANYAALPVTGSTSVMYVTLDTNKLYRWSGSTYVEISPTEVPTLASVLDTDNESGANDISFDAGQGLYFANTSRLREGTIDAGLGGTKGVAQICAVGYELKWEAGRLYVMNGNGNGIRFSLYNFNITPTVDDDVTKGYGIGSIWTLDNEDTYECTDATTGAAVWNIVSNSDWSATTGSKFIANKPTIPTVDANPTDGSSNAVSSNGVFDSLALKQNIAPSVQSVVSSATVTPVFGNDLVVITAQAAGLTLANPTGSWVQGKDLIIRIKDNATPRSITYGAKYRAIGVTLPTTTVASKTTYLGMVYNSTDDTFDVIGVTTQA